jgi:hypothetical protein
MPKRIAYVMPIIFSIFISAAYTTDTAPAPRVPQIGQGQDKTQQTVSLSEIPILKSKLWQSKHFTIDDKVQINGYYYIFTVRTTKAVHKVVSVRKLIKFCHEIDVLEEYKATQKGSHVLKGMGQSISTVGKGAGNLIIHPGRSAKRVGAGFGRVFRSIGGAFKKKKVVPTKAADGTDHALLGKGPAGAERRTLAAELGLDVYTDNKEVQDFLIKVARKRLAGKLPISASVFALPGGSIFTLSLTPMGHDKSTELLIRNQGPAELRKTLGEKYNELFGLAYGPEDSPITQLLNNPNYTPRQQAYLWRYFADLKGLAKINESLVFLSQIDTPEKAEVACAQAELLALLHTRSKNMKSFAILRNTLGAITADNTLCFLISRDSIRYWSDVKTSIKLGASAGKAHKANRVEFWSTGDIDTRSAQLAAEYGIAVYQNILEYDIFSRPREVAAK